MFGCFLKGERTFTSISKLSPGIDLGQFFRQAPDGTALTLDGQEDLAGTIHPSLNGGGEATYSGKDFCFCQLFLSVHLFPNKWNSAIVDRARACHNDSGYLMRQALMGYMERGKSPAPNSWQTPRVFRKPLGSYT
jgi:hypothetical protein